MDADSSQDEDFQSKYISPPRNTKEKALTIAKNAAGLVKDKVMAAAPSEEDVTATAKHMAEIVKDGVTVAVFAAADAASKAAKSDIAVQGKATAMKIAAAASANVKKAILGDALVLCAQELLGNECPPDIVTFDSDGDEWKASEGFEMDEVHYDALGVSDVWHCLVANGEQASERRERIKKEWMARPEAGRRRDPKRKYGGPELWVKGALVETSGTKTRTSHGVMHAEDASQIEGT